MNSHTRSRVALNAAVGTVSQLLAIVVGLVTTPVILHSLGTTNYGAFALVGSLTAYFGILDLGIGGSLTRFITFYHERGDRQRIGAFMTFGVLFYVALGLLLLPLTWWSAPAIAAFIGLPSAVAAQFPLLIATVVLLFTGWSLAGVLTARLAAAHRLDLSGYATIAGTLVYALLVYLWVPLAGTIESIFVCMALQLIVVILLLLISNHRNNGLFFVGPRALRGAGMRELFTFGLWSQLSNVTAVINLEADKAVISRNIGVEQVTPYHVANRLALLSRALPLQLLGSLLPAVTALVSRGASGEELTQLYERTSRGLMIPTLVIVGFVAGGADALLRLWLGINMPNAAALCVALVVSYAVNNVTGAGTLILRAEGHPQLETFYGILSAVLNIGLTIMLIGPLGLNGVVLGTIIGNVVGSLVFVILFHRRKRFGWWPTMGHWLVKLVLVTGGSSILAHAFLRTVAPSTTARLPLLLWLGIAGTGYCVLCYALGRLTGLWIASDRMLWNRIVGKLRARREQRSA